ncbi:lytic transglycosylase domain-containing protein [Flavisolibacter ginsenosidimutans]|uniref:Lytic transglycosylase domain-containing protein n=1 Tax=Flavisolibacter ginsenosidimutans TaxID=661481 RepID=A0A5B8UPX0_9BACT|nr:lytic transglycosylase domain-containing protein [Flavisolibacter ginsenosidimutans]QEC58090.1 lytic transglycosylase domain-containing protein [Flavisolibacter ginsenosidimutans]
MNKLLLLATILVSFLLRDYAAATPLRGTSNQSDTTDVELLKTDPKLGFKDLFEQGTESDFQFAKLNPRAVSFVQDYMEEEGENLARLKITGKRYFTIIESALEKRNLPTELKYLAVIESELKPGATSVKGAGGPWQLMPETARDLGLRVNGRVDERRDYFKSTYAAARYLAYLYELYNDWLLVIAAYNGGPGKVNTAIKRSGSRNFWDLQQYLPAESRNHVKKFIATHYIMEGEGGLTTLTKAETDDLNLSPTVVDGSIAVQNISGKYHSKAIADNIKMSLPEFARLNPNFDKQLSLKGTYELRLPNDKMELFTLNKVPILQESVSILLGMVKN